MKRTLILLMCLCLCSGCNKVRSTQKISINNCFLSADSYHYDIVFDNVEKSISGTAEIKITNKTNTAVNELHIRNYASAVSKSEIIGLASAGKALEISAVKDKSVIIAALNKKLKPDKTITVAISFKTEIPKVQEKFGYTVYEDKEIYNLSSCFPTLSLFNGEAWYDHPYIESGGESNFTHISSYTAAVSLPAGYTLVATGDETVANGKTEINGENLREMAMVISNSFNKIAESTAGTDINYYYLNFENNSSYSEKMLSAAVDSFKLYSDYFGNYIHSELDIVQTFLGSAMEFSGLVMLGFPDVSSDEIKNLDNSHLYDDLQRQSTTAHEVGHQWFYSAVGNDPYSEPWLDEGITEFCEDILYRRSKPEVDFGEIPLSEMDNYINQVVKDKFIINKSYPEYAEDGDYSWYVYNGGKMFLYELEKALGGDTFKEALREYYHTYKLKIAATKDFLNIIKKYDSENKTQAIINKYIEEQ